METTNKRRREQKMHRNYFVHPIRKRFIDAFPKFKQETGDTLDYFWETWQKSPFYDATLTETDLQDIYNHLLATYYNWHFIYPDDLGISLNVMHVIHDFYPNTKERLKLVKDIRELSLDEFKNSGTDIQSSGQNPKVEQAMTELIELVDSQVVNSSLKSEEQALKAKFFALYDGVMEQFIDRFGYMFVKLYSGVNDYIYSNKFDDEEEE